MRPPSPFERQRRRPQNATETVGPDPLSSRLLRLAGWIAASGGALLVGLVLLIQIDAVSSMVGRRVAGVISSPGLALSVDEVTGSWILGLRVTDLRVSSFTDGGEPGAGHGAPGWEVRADTLSVDYRLLSLLRRTVSLTRVEGDGVRVLVRLAAEDTASMEPEEPDSGEGPGWTVRAQDVGLRRGELRMETSTVLPDTTGSEEPWILDRAILLAQDLRIGPGIQVDVDSLRGRVRPVGGSDVEGRVLAVGAFQMDRLQLDTLLLETSESHLEARGRIPLGVPWPPTEGMELDLVARPLHLRDLRPFLPATLPDSIRIQARGHAGTEDGVLAVDFQARSSGSASAELRGRLGRDGSGQESTLSLRVEDLDLRTWGAAEGARVVDLTLEARADSLSGPWQGEWSGRTRGVRVAGTAGMTFRDPLAWQVEGQGSWDPSAGAPPLPTVDSTGVTLTFHGAGEGTSLEGLRARAGIRMESGTLAQGLAEGLAAEGTVEEGEGRFTVVGRVGGGTLEAEGRGSLAALPELRASADLWVWDARPGGVPLDSLSMQVEARDGMVRVRAGARFPDSGRIHLAGTVSPDAEGTEFGLDSLRFAELDLRTLVGASDSAGVPSSRLTGLFRGGGRLAEEGWWAEGELQVDSSRVGTGTIRSGTVEARMDSEGGAVTLELATAEGGGVEGELRVAAWPPASHVAVPELRFRALDLGALGGGDPGMTRITGTFSGEVRGVNVSEMTGRAEWSLDSSRVAGRPLTSSTLDAEIRSGRVLARLGLESGGAVLELEGDAGLGDSVPTYRAEGTLDRWQASAGSFATRFHLEGRGIQPDSMEARAWMEVDSARWNEVVLDTGRLEASLVRGVFRLDTLALESSAASVSGGGALPLSPRQGQDGELRLTGAIHRADMLAGLVGAQLLAVGEATFHATAAGAFRELDLSGEGRINALLMDETQLQGAEADFQAQRTGEEGWTQGSAELRVDRFQTASFSLQSLDVEMDLVEEGTELSLSASAILDESREGRLSARVEDVPSSSAVRLEELEFKADEDEWKLIRPARISFSRGVEVDSLILEAGDQAVRVHGRIGSTGPLSLGLEMERFRLGTLTDLLGVPALQGQASGSLALTGTAEAPNMELQAQADLDPEDADSSHLELSAGYTDRSLDFEARAEMAEGRGFRVDGFIPFSFSLSDSAGGLLDAEAMEVEVRVDSLPLTWVGLFLSPETVRRLRGVAHGSFRLQGSPGDPSLVGDLALHQVAAGLPALGVGYRNGEARLRFREDLIHLDTLTVRSGEGTLNGSGTVTVASLKEPEYDLSIRARDFRAMASSGVNAVVSGDLRISGTSLRPSVVGEVEVRQADIYLDDLTSSQSVETVPLSEEDYRELARVFGYRKPSSTPRTSPGLFQNASLELRVDLRRNSWIRQRTNPEMAIQFSGNLSLRKAPGDSLRLVGEVSAVSERSYVEQFGRRFSLTQGELVFQGAPLATRVDLRAEYEVPSRDNPQAPEVTIALDITGTPEDLRLDLSSSPPLEASDMISYLAVGRPAGRSMGGGGGGLTETGGALALGSLSGAVEAYAREQVGLDVVEITTDGLDGVTLLAGRYVSPELYLGIRQPISLQRGSGESSERAADPEIELEFQAIRWLLLNLQAGGRGGIEFFVRSRISYE